MFLKKLIVRFLNWVLACSKKCEGSSNVFIFIFCLATCRTDDHVSSTWQKCLKIPCSKWFKNLFHRLDDLEGPHLEISFNYCHIYNIYIYLSLLIENTFHFWFWIGIFWKVVLVWNWNLGFIWGNLAWICMFQIWNPFRIAIF